MPHTKCRIVKAITITAEMLLSTIVLLSLVVLLGRIPVSGNISVDLDQSDRLQRIMKENGLRFWTGRGTLGMMDVQIDNPFALHAVDDAIIEDARRNKYLAIVHYKCIIPLFNYSVTVD